MSKDNHFIFVVHTKNYSGNFERELCGFLTGMVGECEVGDDQAELFKEDVAPELVEKFSDMVTDMPDEDNGCMRPCVIWPTPGRYNNGYGGHFDDSVETTDTKWPAYESVAIFFSKQPTQDMIDLMKQRAAEYDEDHAIGVTGFQLLKRETITTPVVVNDSELSI